MADTPVPPTVWPCINYVDAPAAIDFLVGLGFRCTFTVPGETGDVIQHSELIWPEGGGVMVGTSNRSGSEFSKLGTGTACIYVATEDPRAVYQRAVASGVTLIRELAETDYGSTEFSFADAEGNLWSFGTYTGQPG